MNFFKALVKRENDSGCGFQSHDLVITDGVNNLSDWKIFFTKLSTQTNLSRIALWENNFKRAENWSQSIFYFYCVPISSHKISFSCQGIIGLLSSGF